MMITKLHSFRKISPKFTSPILHYLLNFPQIQINSNYPNYNLTTIQNFHFSHKINPNLNPKPSISKPKSLSTVIQAQNPSKLALELENLVNEKNLEKTWILYNQHINSNNLPPKPILTKLIIILTETFDQNYLQNSYEIVHQAFDQNKFDFLERETLIYLSYILARFQMPLQALNVIRKLIKMKLFPPISSLCGIVAHMCQTEKGSFIACELISEIIHIFQNNRINQWKNINDNKSLLLMKPNSFLFALVLMGCVNFNITKKAEQILDLVSRFLPKPGFDLLVFMAIVHERNGRINELMKLKRYIEQRVGVRNLDLERLMQIYECLFSCNLEYGSLNSCVELVLDLKIASKTVLQNENDYKFINKQSINYISFLNDTNYSILQNEAKEFLDISLNNLRAKMELINSGNGIVYPSEKLYAKLVKKFLEENRITELASFLIKSPFVVDQVINACINLGLSDHAHDLLDEMRNSGIRVCDSVYSNLLVAYQKNNCQNEIEILIQDARQAGVQLDCYESETLISQNNSNLIIKSSQKSDNDNNEASLMDELLEEIKRNPNCTDRDANDWNNVIHFFCKKKMMSDAKKAFNKMKLNNQIPNAQTFHSLITAYASIGGKYADVADLWGEMKILKNSNLIKFDQELLDSLLYCFVRGGFFLRAMEIVEIMERNDMFVDKYKYRSLWLKYHRTLYKGKVGKVQNEAQIVRREAALNFKRWIGLN
ncbi:hypothetical protein LUZ60_005584 [Juncus effusus]|nr:hypothetical protein LUZ60_005584 [Juncus effusus]